jgi:hypothetical protein
MSYRRVLRCFDSDMGVSVSYRFHTDDITEALDLLDIAASGRRWRCRRDGDVSTVSEGTQTKMRILGGGLIKDNDFPKTAVITGMVDGDGEAGTITIQAGPSAGVDTVGAKVMIPGRWESALHTWVAELVEAMGAKAQGA